MDPKDIQDVGWIIQLGGMANSQVIDEERREIARNLLLSLKIESKRMERIKELAKLLLSAYKLTSPLLLIGGGDFIYERRRFS